MRDGSHSGHGESGHAQLKTASTPAAVHFPPVRIWLLSILGGLAMAAVGSVVGLGVAYGALALRGVTEHEGRRGMLAFVYGVILGAPVGFWVGFKLAWWLCAGG